VLQESFFKFLIFTFLYEKVKNIIMSCEHIFEFGMYIFLVTDNPKLSKIRLIEENRNCKFLFKKKEPEFYVFIFLKDPKKIYFKTEKKENTRFSVLGKEDDYIKVLYGESSYRVPLKVIYLLLFKIYREGEVDITSFQKLLNSKNLKVDFLDKRKRNDYIIYWHLPNRILSRFFESTKIGEIKREKNSSKRVLIIKTEIDLIKLWRKFLEWLGQI